MTGWLTDDEKAKIKKMWDEGFVQSRIAKELGIANQTVRKYRNG